MLAIIHYFVKLINRKYLIFLALRKHIMIKKWGNRGYVPNGLPHQQLELQGIHMIFVLLTFFLTFISCNLRAMHPEQLQLQKYKIALNKSYKKSLNNEFNIWKKNPALSKSASEDPIKKYDQITQLVKNTIAESEYASSLQEKKIALDKLTFLLQYEEIKNLHIDDQWTSAQDLLDTAIKELLERHYKYLPDNQEMPIIPAIVAYEPNVTNQVVIEQPINAPVLPATIKPVEVVSKQPEYVCKGHDYLPEISDNSKKIDIGLTKAEQQDEWNPKKQEQKTFFQKFSVFTSWIRKRPMQIVMTTTVMVTAFAIKFKNLWFGKK